MSKTAATVTGKPPPDFLFKDGFPEPNSTWLRDQFSKTRIGAMKASELELYLAYQLMWANDDLSKSPYDIASTYGYTESKTARLLQEFSVRFRVEEDDAQFLARLWNSIVGQDPGATSGSIVPVVQGSEVALSIQSPYDRNRLRHIVENEGLPWSSDFNKKLVRLPLFILVYVFRGQNAKFKDAIQKAREKFLKETGLQEATLTSIAIYYVKRGAEFIDVVSKYLGPLHWMDKLLMGN